VNLIVLFVFDDILSADDGVLFAHPNLIVVVFKFFGNLPVGLFIVLHGGVAAQLDVHRLGRCNFL